MNIHGADVTLQRSSRATFDIVTARTLPWSANSPCRTDEVNPLFYIVLDSRLTPSQLHPAPRQRRPIRLLNPRLPVALLASPARRSAILLPLQSRRHSALHHLLDASTCRRHTPDCRTLGVHDTMAQLEDHMGRATAVCGCWCT